MWTEGTNRSDTLNNRSMSSSAKRLEMSDPDFPQQLSPAALHSNGSTAAVTHPSCTDQTLSCGRSGIIPGSIAAAVFITFLLALYAVLWKCMVSPPKRKHSKVRVRVHQRSSV